MICHWRTFKSTWTKRPRHEFDIYENYFHCNSLQSSSSALMSMRSSVPQGLALVPSSAATSASLAAIAAESRLPGTLLTPSCNPLVRKVPCTGCPDADDMGETDIDLCENV